MSPMDTRRWRDTSDFRHGLPGYSDPLLIRTGRCESITHTGLRVDLEPLFDGLDR